MDRILTTSAIAALLMLIAPGSGAFAAENATGTQKAAAECKLAEVLDRLLEIKDSELEGRAKEEAEFDARREVLNEIILCSFAEIESFKIRLADLKLGDSDKKDRLLREKYAGDLDAAAFYFHKMQETLAEKLALADIKKLAAETLAWRESFYIPAVRRVNDFILVIESAEMIKTARTRFQKISGTLSAVRLNEMRDIKLLLRESENRLEEAEQKNTEAHELIWDLGKVFESATTTEATSTGEQEASEKKAESKGEIKTATSSEEAMGKEPPPSKEVLPLVKDSLGSVKKAYANYLAISKLVRKVLGL